MEIVFKKEVKYKTLCQMMDEKESKGGHNRKQQLERWSKKYKISKVGRGKYIIERPLTEQEKEEYSFNPKRYDLKLKDYCDKRYIKILTPVDGHSKCEDIIKYECMMHKNVIQEGRICDVLTNIGCPLCQYPMSRFEVMLYLGLEGSLHRQKIQDTEFDIILPKEKIAIEVDGAIFHNNFDEPEKENEKYIIAEKNGYKLIKIYEQRLKDNNGIYREDDKIYIIPYAQMNKDEREKTIKLIQEILPYKHSNDLWNEAADYMRKWKYNHHKIKKEITHKTKHSIKQYDANGNLVYEYKNFNEIKEMIALGNAFGFKWEIE